MSTEISLLLDRAALSPSHPLDTPTILRAARRRTLRRRAILIGIPLATVCLLASAVGSSSLLSGPSEPRIVTHAPDTATKGTMPAARPDGSVDPAKVPDFISTLDRSGNVVGYVKREALLDPSPDSPPQTVYGEDLKTIVGHMYAGRGFVPVGQDPATVPLLPSSTTAITAPR